MPRPVVNESAADKRPTVAIVAICAAFFILGVNRLWVPEMLYFDEKWYYGAALKMQSGIVVNREHPPLAKELIAAFLWISGNTWVGIRIGSLVFATAGLMAFQFAQFTMTRSARSTIVFGLLLAGNCLYFATARVAILDPYMLGFAGIACALLAAALCAPKPRHSLTALAGFAVGLSLACKWGTLPLFAVMGAAIMWRHRRSFRHLLIGGTVFSLTAVLAYAVPFAPLVFTHVDPIPLFDLPALQRAMYFVLGLMIGGHPYASHWWDWPIGLGGMWLYDATPRGDGRIIIMGQNPVAVAVTLVALGWAVLRGVQQRGPAVLAPLALYFVSMAFWAAGGKPIQFIYSYNLQAIAGLSIAAQLLASAMTPRTRLIAGAVLTSYCAWFAWAYPAMTAARAGDVAGRMQDIWGWERTKHPDRLYRPVGNGNALVRWSTHCVAEPTAPDCRSARQNEALTPDFDPRAGESPPRPSDLIRR